MKNFHFTLAAALVAGLVQFAVAGDCCRRCKTPTCCDWCDDGAEKPCASCCGCGRTAKCCEKSWLDFLFKPHNCHAHCRNELCSGCCAGGSSCCERHAPEAMEAAPADGKAPLKKPMPPKLPSARRGSLLDILVGRNR